MINYTDAVFYQYYGHLDVKKRTLYQEVYKSIMSGRQTFKITQPASSQDVFDVVKAIYNDHPEIFWMKGGCKAETINGYVTKVELSCNALFSQMKKRQEELNQAIRQYLSGLSGKSPLEQERLIHDRMVNNVSYIANEYDQTAYGALVMGRAVCAGYSRGFQLLMQLIGIPCYYVYGTAVNTRNPVFQDHAWNVLKLGNEYYNMDLTWDDCYDASEGKISFIYYNCTDAVIEKNHRRHADCRFLPKCTGTTYSFERINGVCAELAVIYQDKVTDQRVVSTQSDFMNVLAPILRTTAKGEYCISFPVNEKKVIDNLTAWFRTAVTSRGKYHGNWGFTSSVTDYHNKWYKVEIRVTLK